MILQRSTRVLAARQAVKKTAATASKLQETETKNESAALLLQRSIRLYIAQQETVKKHIAYSTALEKLLEQERLGQM